MGWDCMCSTSLRDCGLQDPMGAWGGFAGYCITQQLVRCSCRVGAAVMQQCARWVSKWLHGGYDALVHCNLQECQFNQHA